MKTINIAKSALVACAMMTGLFANAQTMTVSLRDGQTAKFATEDIEKVTFSDVGQKLEQGPFAIEVTEVTGASAHLSVVPESPTQRYYFDVCSRASYEKYSVADIVSSFYNNLMKSYPGLSMSTYLDATTSIGPDADDVINLPDDTDMVCYAIAISDECKPVGEPSVVAFRTLKGGDPADCTFTLTCTNVRGTEATITVTPSDPTVRYWYGCYSMAEWPGDAAVQMSVKQALDDAVEISGLDLEYIVESATFRGATTENESGFESATRYYIYAFAVDMQGNPAGPMFKEIFTTLASDYSDADVSLSYRYFDGSEMKAAYPDKFPDTDDWIIVQAKITPNEMAQNYVWGLLPGDYTEETTFPEELSKQSLLQGGWVNIPVKNIYAKYGEATFMYFGSDQWGIDGPLHRLYVNFEKSGVSPVSEYQDPDQLTPAGAPMKIKPIKVTKPSRINARINRIYQVPTTFRKVF